VIGTLSGSVAATVAALVVSPYELRFRYERDSMREYASFSWPVLLNSAGNVLTFQVPVTLASRVLGIASVGAITLSSQITQYAYRVDDVVTHALYPAICAVKDQRELLFESFSKSNRLALLWGFPAGVAAALFAHQAVHFVLGDRWRLAIPLIAVLGASAAVDQIGFNWTAFARARAETRFLAIQSGTLLAAVLGIGVPLLLIDGLPGLAIGFAAGTLASLGIRLVYLLRLFPALAIVRHTVGAIVPTLVGVCAILIERAVVRASGDSVARTVVEAVGYVVIVGGLSWMTERALLRETIGYLRRAMAPRPGIAA
jgi:O-antigen/teichoic acid export membrane protein